MVTIEKYKSAQSTDANDEKKRPAAEVEREEKRVKQDAVTVSLFPKVEIQDDPVCEIIFLVDRYVPSIRPSSILHNFIYIIDF